MNKTSRNQHPAAQVGVAAGDFCAFGSMSPPQCPLAMRADHGSPEN